MLVKTKKNDKGQQLYQRVHMSGIDKQCKKQYFEEGTLSEVQSQPSMRAAKRTPKNLPRPHNNRKPTAGRLNQVTLCGKVIRHETQASLYRKKLMFEKRYKN